ERWMFTWVDDIRELDRLNAARLEQWDAGWPLEQQASAFAQSQGDLETQLRQMQERCEAHLHESDRHLAKQKVLSSLHHHWDGLTVFVERPAVAMDTNTAERALRNPVVGRKNYYGSGSVWSAHLAAMRLSVLQTVLLWGLNPPHWLQTPPTPALRLCIIKPTGFSGFFRECNPCFSGHYKFFPLKKANLLNDALVERRLWRGLLAERLLT